MPPTRRTYTRVAVVQLNYQPAALIQRRSPLEEPLAALTHPEGLLPTDGTMPPELEQRYRALRQRIRQTYDDQLLQRLQTILRTCQSWGVRLVVFPEYSIPWEILGGVADAAGDMVVVAGTHAVERATRDSGMYERLGWTAVPAPRMSVCPVLHQQRLIAMQPKLNPAFPEQGSMRSGQTWQSVALPDGLTGPMGVLICLDFLFRESERYQQLVAAQIETCRFLAVPSLTPHYTLNEFAAKAWEEARRYRRPVLYADIASGGGTSIYVDEGTPTDLRRFPEHVGYLETFGGSFFVREGEDCYRFAHKSFLEFFLARSLVRTLPERPAAALHTKPLTSEVAAFVHELLRRDGDPQHSQAVQAVHIWLTQGRRSMAITMSDLDATALPAANAVRLLVGLSRWAQQADGWMPEDADLRRVSLVNEDLHDVELVASDLQESDLSCCNLIGANLSQARLIQSRLVGSCLDCAVLTGAHAQKANFTFVSADHARLEQANLTEAVLRQSTWTECVWTNASLTEAEITACAIYGTQHLPVPTLTVGMQAMHATIVRGHTAPVQAVAWAPDGQRLASSSEDKSVRLWDTQSGQELACLEGHMDTVRAVAWAPDGQRLASTSDDGSVRLWDIKRGVLQCVLEMCADSTLARTPQGFCLFSQDITRYRLAIPRPEQPDTVLYLPLGGLRAVLERPDKVRAALAGDLSGDDLQAEIDRYGWRSGSPWDGTVQKVSAVTFPTSTHSATDVSPGTKTTHFRPGPALIDADSLPGREVVLQELLALIDSRSPAVLRGPRRSGKTSLLHTLHRRLEQTHQVRHATLEGAQARTADDLACLLAPDLCGTLSPATVLRQRFRAENNPVLLLDEITHLSAADLDSFAWLRAVGQYEASLVLVGSHWDWVQVVEHAASGPGSSFGNDVTPVTPGPRAPSDAVQFLVDTAAADGITLSRDGTAAWIVEVCGPWPFYLQVLGHAVVQAVRSGTRQALVERRGVRDLYEQRLLRDRSTVFQSRWQELPPLLRAVLTRTQDGQLPSYRQLSRRERQAARDSGLCTAAGVWVEDRPFFNWMRQNAEDM